MSSFKLSGNYCINETPFTHKLCNLRSRFKNHSPITSNSPSINEGLYHHQKPYNHQAAIRFTTTSPKSAAPFSRANPHLPRLSPPKQAAIHAPTRAAASIARHHAAPPPQRHFPIDPPPNCAATAPPPRSLGCLAQTNTRV
jgi:hypothetical protein